MTLLRALSPAGVGTGPGTPAPEQARQETRTRLGGVRPGMPAGVGRPGPDPRTDPLQAVGARFDLVRGSVQLTTQEVAEVLALRGRAVVAGSHHYSCSRAARRADMPRAV